MYVSNFEFFNELFVVYLFIVADLGGRAVPGTNMSLQFEVIQNGLSVLSPVFLLKIRPCIAGMKL